MTDRPDFDFTNEDHFAALPTETMNEVIPHLSVADAGIDPSVAWPEGVHLVVNLSGWMKDRIRVPKDRMYVAWNFDDADLPDQTKLDALARLVATTVGAGRDTVVYCAGGLNRSALVAAKALVVLGHEPRAAVELIRRARGMWALSNRAFEGALLEASHQGIERPIADD